MKYVVASTTVTDEIRFADSSDAVRVIGGAGIYALCGMKLWEDDVTLVTGVGTDYFNLYSSWYQENGISMDGLIPKAELTPHNIIQYFENGERSETPLYGKDHYKNIEVTAEELEPYVSQADGMYIFKNSNADFWEKIIRYKESASIKIMWEIASDAAYLDNLDQVKRIAEQMDVFSINLTEARSLLGEEDLEQMIRTLQTWKVELIFLRCGSKGAVMITPEECAEVGSVRGIHVVDPTGGGNSSSGAVLCGWVEGRDIKTCGLMGSISAAMCLQQYGVPSQIGEGEREMAAGKLLEMRAALLSMSTYLLPTNSTIVRKKG